MTPPAGDTMALLEAASIALNGAIATLVVDGLPVAEPLSLALEALRDDLDEVLAQVADGDL